METALEFRRYSFTNKDIEISLNLSHDLPRTMADSGQLLEVFLNMILNAENSVIKSGHRGRLAITTETKGHNIVITFSDNGVGIKNEDIEKIFNPFYTTRGIGEGTGLGLSICHGIITAHQGEITVHSEAGNGATFTIELPVLKPAIPGTAGFEKGA
jgi:signal transduction histidine kinase